MKEPKEVNHNYAEQQQALDNIACKLGVVAYRPCYHGEKRDKYTVLFYTKEDYLYNQKLDQENGKFVSNDDYHKYFFSFENTDANGMLDYGYANFGHIRLNCGDEAKILEGAVTLALAKRRQNEYVRAAGGLMSIYEADDTYNDYNRSIIQAYAMMHRAVWLGSVNPSSAQDGAPLVKYAGEKLYNFCCGFCVPTNDAVLLQFINNWRATGDAAELKKIEKRIEQLDGLSVVWF